MDRRSLISAVVATLAVTAGSLPTVSWAQGAAGDGLVIYNAQHVSLTKEWADAFTASTGMKVTVRNGGDTELGNQLVQEGRDSSADVFLTENSPAMTLVDRAGLFAPVDKDTLAQVPAAFRPSDGRWIGIAARSTVFVYNKDKIRPEQLPRSIMDLAAPAWKGRWGASPAGADFQAIVSAMLELKGKDATLAWLKAVKQNATIYRGNGNVLKAVNAGQTDGGIIYHYYYFGDQAKTGENSDKVDLYYFRNQDPGAFVSVSGAGVLASSKHQAQAQAFLKWLTGKGGQRVLETGDSFEYAVGVGMPSNPKLVPLTDLHPPAVDPAKLNSKEVTELMMDAGFL